MTWDVLGGGAKWPMTNVRQLGLPQWRRLAEKPQNRCIVPMTEFCEFSPDKHDLGDGKPPLKGEMWFSTDQHVFPVAGLWQHTKDGAGFRMVTCDPNELVAPIHPKAMITILEPEDVDTWLRARTTRFRGPMMPQGRRVRGPVFPTRTGEK
jgi:Uncharacterized conserved protein